MWSEQSQVNKKVVFGTVILACLLLAGFFLYRWEPVKRYVYTKTHKYEPEGIGIPGDGAIRSDNVITYSFLFPKPESMKYIDRASSRIDVLITRDGDQINVFDVDYITNETGNAAHFITFLDQSEILKFYEDIPGFIIDKKYLSQERGFIEMQNSFFIARISLQKEAQGLYRISITSLNK